jgi:hypothetical protein
MSKPYAHLRGGEILHVVGYPFIRGPSLSLLIKTPFGVFKTNQVEYFSESVLFFELPSLASFVEDDSREIEASLVVTNDGKHFSNPLTFTYYGRRDDFLCDCRRQMESRPF